MLAKSGVVSNEVFSARRRRTKTLTCRDDTLTIRWFSTSPPADHGGDHDGPSNSSRPQTGYYADKADNCRRRRPFRSFSI
jgi:hypothetical protein